MATDYFGGYSQRVEAKYFCATLHVNAINPKLSDAEFRAFVIRSLSTVEYQRPTGPIFIYVDRDLPRAKRVMQGLEKEYPRMEFKVSAPEGVGTIWIPTPNHIALDLVAEMIASAAKIAKKKVRKHVNSNNRTRATKSVRR